MAGRRVALAGRQLAMALRVSDRLSQAMAIRGYSRKRLSRESSVAEYTIQRILKAENTNLATLVTLCATLQIPLSGVVEAPRGTTS